MDIFRIEDGVIVEQWNAVQEVPDTTVNGNTMFDGGNQLNATLYLESVIYGTSNSDLLSGTNKTDLIFAEDSNDTIAAGFGNDEIFGENGKDVLHGNSGNDTIRGGADDDYIKGNSGNDVLFGDVGKDTLIGSYGEDRIVGGADNDIMKGQDGKDILAGETGLDYAVGGSGDDIFVLSQGKGFVTIEDFEDGKDLLQLNDDLSFRSLSIEKTGNLTAIRDSSDILALLQDTNSDTITSADFTKNL